MSSDDWTPLRGWTLAVIFMVLNACGVAIASAGLLIAISPLADDIPPTWPAMAGVSLAAFVIGWLCGYVAAKKLRERSGLGGAALIVPLAATLVLAQIAAFQGVLAIREQMAEQLFLVVSIGIGVGSVISACRKLLTSPTV